MKKLILISLTILLTLSFNFSQSQTIIELYNSKNYRELIKFETKTDTLNKNEIYYLGYAFFQLENDIKAIEMYDKAIKKGLNKDFIYFYKGLSLRFNQQYDYAIKSFKIAIDKNSKGQKNYTELANTFLAIKKTDSALVYFYKARKLPFETGDSYVKIPGIYRLNGDFEKSLSEYRKSKSLVDKASSTYLEILDFIGLLEYQIFKNYDKAVEAYSEYISINKMNHDVYANLIRTYYGAKNYKKGDSVFDVMKIEYKKGKLMENYQKYGKMSIASFKWNEQNVTIYKYFENPKDVLDLMYKIYVFSKDNQSVQRTLTVEKTIQINKKSIKYLLCEEGKDGTHYTYPYGWVNDEIDFKSLKESITLVLDKEGL
jgi:tetratricopeptide (TPR) repeat protein